MLLFALLIVLYNLSSAIIIENEYDFSVISLFDKIAIVGESQSSFLCKIF